MEDLQVSLFCLPDRQQCKIRGRRLAALHAWAEATALCEPSFGLSPDHPARQDFSLGKPCF